MPVTRSNKLVSANLTDEVPVAETSHRWAEFRLSVVGSLVVGYVGRGQLSAELKSLSARKWKHPITGREVAFSYPTISRWYYIAHNQPNACVGALSRKRCDTGIPRSLTKQVRHYLKGEAKRHPSRCFSQHHKTLLQHMKKRGWGRPPGYSTVRRYVKSLGSLGSLQDLGVCAEIERLEALVVHLRRTLIVESTINRLLRVPEIRVKTFGQPFKFTRLGPSEKAYVLSRLQDYRSTGGSQFEFCSSIGISGASIQRWRTLYRRYGQAGLCQRIRRKFPNRTTALARKARILEIFHSQPSTYGINRASWTGETLVTALYKKYKMTISASTACRFLRESGYTMRRARQVLTSSDPDYRTKVEVLLQILQTLGDTETLFFIDELGPLAVKKHGGRVFAKKGAPPTVPQLQTPKGSIVLAGALCATTNQMTWCYTHSKDSTAMIDIIELVFSEHQDKTHLYITWDAASWHDSILLIDWLNDFNLKTSEAKEGPLITLVPLPSCSQFLNVIESVFGVMKRAVIHHSDYRSAHEMKSAISLHFLERNAYFKENPRRAGTKIWKLEFFHDYGSLLSGNYREY
jgi:transposase